MFSQTPEEEPPKNNKVPFKKRNKRKKKNSLNKNNNFKRDKKRQTKVVCPMSSMAENFDKIASWQLKHQVAYWKARAKSLEYENKVLHDIIRKRQMQASTASHSGHSESDSGDDDIEEPEMNGDDNIEEPEMSEGGDEDNLEVSEEFIQFLITNAKYKEEAKKERERLKALKEEKEPDSIPFEEMPAETPEKRQRKWEELYGEGWQRISALEMSLHSKFINESDKGKPAYWPNIPFNPFNTPVVYAQPI